MHAFMYIKNGSLRLAAAIHGFSVCLIDVIDFYSIQVDYLLKLSVLLRNLSDVMDNRIATGEILLVDLLANYWRLGGLHKLWKYHSLSCRKLE